MTTPSTREWQRANDEFLADALRWIRANLELLARKHESVLDGQKLETEVSQARRRVESQLADGQCALAELATRFGLSTFERDVVLLCAAIEFDTRVAGLCASALGVPGRSYVNFALCMALFESPSWDAISPGRPLRHWQLIELVQQTHTPLTCCPIRAAERVVNYLKGLDHLDDRLTPWLSKLAKSNESDLAPSQVQIVEAIVAETTYSSLPNAAAKVRTVQLLGCDSAIKQTVASCVAERLRLEVFRLPAELLPSSVEDLDELARLWGRETRLSSLALYVDTSNALRSGRQEWLAHWLQRVDGLVFVDVPDGHGMSALGPVFEVNKPTTQEQRRAWSEVLPSQIDSYATQLAGQFRLDLASIRQIGRETQHTFDQNGIGICGIWRACARRVRPRLEELAQRVDAKATWDDLVLPPDQLQLLHQIVEQVRQRVRVLDDWGFREKLNRGFGTAALFSGESGTGKTMAAEVLATELNLDLYRIDLSTVISKYIGETEKNLRRLFDAAEDGGVILFFDEADALFGKRSEVKDSHDRYANIEINFLLQRMETYRGLAILATNFKSALDSAFLRRLKFVVQFPFPDSARRREMWQRAFPAQTPKGQLDFDRLARLHINGGNIHNIALNAAFTAATRGQQLDMQTLLESARGEYVKIQKPIDLAIFKPTVREASA